MVYILSQEGNLVEKNCSSSSSVIMDSNDNHEKTAIEKVKACSCFYFPEINQQLTWLYLCSSHSLPGGCPVG